ncbi:hypothetical protein ABZZ79_03025 [Streptomyces sp. NPDC006458]|uniref:hypothetical protein n=1 Tax=Streptomyces sp. NPDC006458 TaxID=3154302 RepID=UPI0033BF703C
MQWGDVPTWGAALFAGGAAWFAYQTITSQRQQIGEQRQFIAEQSANLALEREALRAAAQERREQQARMVQVQEGIRAFSIGALQNLSDAPIYEIIIRFGNDQPKVGRLIQDQRAQTLGRVSTPFEDRPMPLEALVAGDALTFELKPEAGERWITFLDDAGVRWSIDRHGKLEEVPPHPVY